jgi:hypothetical protein
MMSPTLLLIFLLVCHYLADFCFTTPKMIRAKADGRNPRPIMLHAAIHAGLMAICLLLWSISWKAVLLAIAVEWITHFLIDLAKARLSIRFLILTDQQQKPYWMLYGLDQLLHQLVIVGIWYYSFMN